MSAFSKIQLKWLTGLLGDESLLVRRAAAETIGESSIQDAELTLSVIAHLGERGLASSGWHRRDLEQLALGKQTLEPCLDMARSLISDRHKLALDLILLHPPELLLPHEKDLLRLPDLTRMEYELIREAIGFYRASSDSLWEKLRTMSMALTKYPMFPRRIKETVKSLAREVSRRPYPLNHELTTILQDDSNPWIKGLACLILAARENRSAAPLILQTLVKSDLAELNEFAEEALVHLQDESIIEEVIEEFPKRDQEYRLVTNSLFYRMPFEQSLQHAARLAEGEDDNVAYGLLLTYCRAFDRFGLERNYAIARSMPDSSELAFLGVESLGYATAVGIELPDRAHWMAEAQQVGLLDEEYDGEEGPNFQVPGNFRYGHETNP
jgi:hypothetical protein